MSFDLAQLRDLTARVGPVVRVVVAETAGSAPRETGAAMLVWCDGAEGTIGGGALEWAAQAQARRALADGQDRVERVALGPALAQCCGGAVTLLYEVWDAARLATVTGDLVLRPLPGKDGEMPLAVRRLMTRARDSGHRPVAGVVQGWMVEPLTRASREIWIWGAGHVGRAVVGVLAAMPDLTITWVDTDLGRFPETGPAGVTVIATTDPVTCVADAPMTAEHLILTYSHALDLALCNALLQRGFGSAGLIGSATKWARFRSRLHALGHAPAEISRIACPIGDPSLGKHPQAIAVGVAVQLLSQSSANQSAKDRAAERG